MASTKKLNRIARKGNDMAGAPNMDGFGSLLIILVIGSVFGLWKLCELIYWLFTNVSINF